MSDNEESDVPVFGLFHVVTSRELARQLKKTEKLILSKLTQIGASIMSDINDEITQFGTSVNAHLDEALTEFTDEITGLKNALTAALEQQGITQLSPQAESVLQSVRDKAQALADAFNAAPAEQGAETPQPADQSAEPPVVEQPEGEPRAMPQEQEFTPIRSPEQPPDQSLPPQQPGQPAQPDQPQQT